MASLLVFALSGLLLCARAQEATPTEPAWITPALTLPSPFASPSIYVTTDGSGSCKASLAVYYSINCRLQTTVYPSTTSLGFPVDCLGCPNLASTVRRGNCPLGGHHSSYPDTTLTTPRTMWSFVCAPTPTPVSAV